MITKATSKDHEILIGIWELSVRATHHFLPGDYLLTIKELLPSIFSQVDTYVHRNEVGHITGFLGVVNDKIEMLFIHPDFRGKGIGRLLTQFALEELQATLVDVNEQNEQAIGFYKRSGFVETGRSETDGLGKPFPLIHMKFAGNDQPIL